MIAFTVNSIPVAQPRQRHAIRGFGAKQFISNYTPTAHPVTAFKSDCRRAAHEVYQGAPIDQPIRLSILAVFPRPKGMMYKTKPMPREYKASKPDADNICKSVQDSLNELIWRDDSLVVELNVIKCIASGTEQPHVKVLIEKIDSAYVPGIFKDLFQTPTFTKENHG